MNEVQRIKERNDMDALLRAIRDQMQANAQKKATQARRQTKHHKPTRKERINAILSKRGIPLRLV